MRRLPLTLLVLLVLAAPVAAADKPKPTTIAGLLAARAATSVTVRDGARTLTCSLGDSSPKLDDYKVGDRVKMACANGVLAAIAKLDARPAPPVAPPPATPPSTPPASGVGSITAVSADSLTVHTDGGDVTCRFTGDWKGLRPNVGDRVKFACSNGVLFALAAADAPKPPPPPTPAPPAIRGANGTIGSLSGDSITVTTDGGNVTCRIGPSSPSRDGFHVGDRAKMLCTNDVLTSLARP